MELKEYTINSSGEKLRLSCWKWMERRRDNEKEWAENLFFFLLNENIDGKWQALKGNCGLNRDKLSIVL